jgi:hypothetical protein
MERKIWIVKTKLYQQEPDSSAEYQEDVDGVFDSLDAAWRYQSDQDQKRAKERVWKCKQVSNFGDYEDDMLFRSVPRWNELDEDIAIELGCSGLWEVVEIRSFPVISRSALE